MDFTAFSKIEAAHASSLDDEYVRAVFAAIQAAIYRQAWDELDTLAVEFWRRHQKHQRRMQTVTTLMRKARVKAILIGDYEISYSADIHMYHIVGLTHPLMKGMKAEEVKAFLHSIITCEQE
jgi:hypothetical protein